MAETWTTVLVVAAVLASGGVVFTKQGTWQFLLSLWAVVILGAGAATLAHVADLGAKAWVLTALTAVEVGALAFAHVDFNHRQAVSSAEDGR
jgi:hypothetical protein